MLMAGYCSHGDSRQTRASVTELTRLRLFLSHFNASPARLMCPPLLLRVFFFFLSLCYPHEPCSRTGKNVVGPIPRYVFNVKARLFPSWWWCFPGNGGQLLGLCCLG